MKIEIEASDLIELLLKANTFDTLLEYNMNNDIPATLLLILYARLLKNSNIKQYLKKYRKKYRNLPYPKYKTRK